MIIQEAFKKAPDFFRNATFDIRFAAENYTEPIFLLHALDIFDPNSINISLHTGIDFPKSARKIRLHTDTGQLLMALAYDWIEDIVTTIQQPETFDPIYYLDIRNQISPEHTPSILLVRDDMDTGRVYFGNYATIDDLKYFLDYMTRPRSR